MSDDDYSTTDVRRRIRRMSWVFASAIGLLFLSVVISVVVTEMEAAQIQTDAQLINVSGRQRMLSQRIIYLASEHQTASLTERAQTAAELSSAIDTFEAAITLFETAHGDLLQAAADTPRIKALYLDAGLSDGASLDDQVRAYITHARQVLANPQDVEALEQLRAIEKAGLLADLDTVVSAFERASVDRIGFLRQVELFSLFFALAIILFEVALIFRPGYRLLYDSFGKLDQRGRALAQARAALRQTLDTVEERNRVIEAEREVLNIALEDSEKLRDEQAAFTYAVSHDLKSPINTIQLLLNEMAHVLPEDTDPELVELVDHAQTATRRMSVLIKDTLEYAWATQDQAEPEWIDVKACLKDVLADLRAELRESEAEVTTGPLEPVFGYRMQLGILLQNLLGNALKYRADGVRPKISVRCEKDTETDATILQVSDNGIGIEPENQERIFGLFQRLHVQTDYPGSGLGLATCQRVALKHAGGIALRSTLGEGSTFEVTLRTPLPHLVSRTEGLAA